MSLFNDGIMNMIEKYSYDAFMVNQNTNVKCICINPSTKEPDPNCKKCLGTGRKIKIKKVRLSSDNTDVAGSKQMIRESVDILITQVYYLPAKYKFSKDDIIVDGDDAYIVYQSSTGQSDHGEVIYNKIMAVDKKYDQTKFMDNFNEIVGRR